MIQLIAGLAAIIGGAHLFVEELLHVAEDIGIEPLVLSLILAPLATELPEKANSFFWVRDGKDALALGNITGAMVFQSTIPIAVGLLLTEWDLSRFAVVSGVLGLVGGAIAYYEIHGKSRFALWAVLAWIGALHRVPVLRARDPDGRLRHRSSPTSTTRASSTSRAEATPFVIALLARARGGTGRG